MDRFYMVLVEGTPGCKVRHTNKDEAFREAERLLRQPQNNDKKVYLLEAVDYVSMIKSIYWSRC